MNVFIAWGIMAALFMPDGIVPHEIFARLVRPMTIWLLPLMMGYAGGCITGGERGGATGAMMTLGLIVGTDIPVFPLAMIAGPLSGKIIGCIDRRAGLQSGWNLTTAVNNFLPGIAGMLLALLAFVFIGPFTDMLSRLFAAAVQFMVANHLLPLTSIFVEPAKILFMDKGISETIFSPLGMEQVAQTGSSVFFLLANPGPGLGMLVACMLSDKHHIRQFAAGAAIIHFLGGIPAIYFPYVLMNPRLILALICGGMAGVLTLVLLQGGTVAPVSPDSLLAILARTPEQARFANLTAIITASVFSFMLSVVLLNVRKKADGYTQEAPVFHRQNTREDLPGFQEEQPPAWMHTRQFSIATDAAEQNQQPLVQERPQDFAVAEDSDDRHLPVFPLSAQSIFLNQHAETKEQAIFFAGEQLVNGGYVEQEYVNAMLIKESLSSSFAGNAVALSWGTVDVGERVLRTGMVFCQYPQGVRFGEEDEIAHLIIGIAMRDEHNEAISDLKRIFDDPLLVARLSTTDSIQEVLDALVQFT